MPQTFVDTRVCVCWTELPWNRENFEIFESDSWPERHENVKKVMEKVK